jgi:predicted DCC family thiol-disulfide oxidoreductase YuxK
MMKTANHQILLFDGVCQFCNDTVQFIIRHDKQETFKFAALHSAIGQELLKKHSLPTNDLQSVVLIKNQSAYTRSTAELHIFLGLGGWWSILYLFVLMPRPIRDGIYNFIAKNRYKWFGKKEECMVPSQEIRKRFLS